MGLSVVIALAFVTWESASSLPESNGELRGTVIDAVSGEPIESAEIEVGGMLAKSDARGTFEIALVSRTAVLRVEATGYLATEVDVAVGGTEEPIEISLFPRNVFFDRVVVQEELGGSDETSSFEVAPEDVFQIAGSVDNIFRTLDTLPGVAATDDFGSRLSVRGGSPDQNLTLLDGVEIHNPFRLSGLTSAFNPETIDTFELNTGGFGAKYGDRLSSILVVNNRAGGRSFGGSASLSITDANVVLEGAMPGGDTGSWLVSGRRTYYDLVAGLGSDNKFPSFADLQAQATWELGGGHRLSIFALGSGENADFDADGNDAKFALLSEARNDLVSASLDMLLGRRWVSNTTAAWYRYRDFADFNGTLQRGAKRSNAPDDDVAIGTDEFIFNRDFFLRDGSLRQSLAWEASSRHTVELGAELHVLASGVQWESLGDDRNVQEANGSSVRGGAGLPDEIDSTLDATRTGLWIQDRWQASPTVTLEPGLRFDRSTANDRSTLSPRVAATFDVGAKATVRAAFGLYTQSPGYEKLIQSDYFVDLSDAREQRLRCERASHFVLGFQKELGPGFGVRVEGYYKRFADLVVGRLETEEERLARVGRYDFPAELENSVPTSPIITSVPSSDSRGRAYGLDFYLSRRDPDSKISGWISYTLGKAERNAYARNYPLEYDRRHSLNITGRYRLSERFDVSMTARLASGFPYTPAVGLRVAAGEDERGRLVPQRDSGGNLVYAPDLGDVGNLNAGRLPVYARFDLRATYRPQGLAGRWAIYVEAINMLNRVNAVSLESRLVHDPSSDLPRLVEIPTEGFPLLPSVGVRFRF